MTRSAICALFALAAAASCAACGNSEPGECAAGEFSCSDDALVLTSCQNGRWQTIECMSERGQLCEAGACVDPWRYGSPHFAGCPDEPLATPESLHQKMVSYEEIARRLHIHPGLKWASGVLLKDGVAESQAGYTDVERWLSGENDGLWSAIYLAAEAFRYGATKDAEALASIKLLLEGERDRMAITGVPGLFTRQFIPPGIPGIECPADPARYVPDVEKSDNQWVKVGQDGCVQVTDPGTLEWVTTDHCGLDDYAGYCWLDNVSQDEYAGHMFALGAVFKMVDDGEVQTAVRDMLQQIGDMLVTTRLEIHDWDSRSVEHGRLYAMALDNFPGFNAAMALDFIKICAQATGDEDIQDFYSHCLLQQHGQVDCIQSPTETPRPYTDYLDNSGLYVGADSCMSNWNNISMHFASLHNLIWFEHDPVLRALIQNHLEHQAFAPADTPRPVADQNNAWFDFIYASQKALGPNSDGPALAAVENGICMLRQFPASKHVPDLDCPAGKCDPVCTDRLGGELGSYARQVAERCPGTFLWWGNPYDLDGCSQDLGRIKPPGDYLLAYWMGRYYGFIDADM